MCCPTSFLLNLSDGHFAKLTLALVLAPGQSDGASRRRGLLADRKRAGTLPEEAVIRDIVTNLMTNRERHDALQRWRAREVKHEILTPSASRPT